MPDGRKEHLVQGFYQGFWHVVTLIGFILARR